MRGSELKRIRRGTLDLSQKELGDILGKCRRTIHTYEQEAGNIPNAIAVAVLGLTREAERLRIAAIPQAGQSSSASG